MTNFKQVTKLTQFDLSKDIEQFNLDWGDSNQICINSPMPDSSDYLLGTGSLQYDWSRSEKIIDQQGNVKWHVPKHKTQFEEKDFRYLVTCFKDTIFEEVFNEITAHWITGRIRLMRSQPKTCLSWHTDTSPRLHYPIKTQSGCLMVIEDEVKHLPQNTWWITETTLQHTALNASKETRIHLVAVLLGPK
jgi:hypothetical protein